MEINWPKLTLAEFSALLKRDGYAIPLSDDLSVLRNPVAIADKTVENRLAIQPMEGCDATEDGSPAELTTRRYLRFAQGGAGMIWAEATAVSPESRANPRQLMLTQSTLVSFASLTDAVRETAVKAHGHAPYLVLQATHSGRYSRPGSKAAPLIAYRCATLEQNGLADGARILRDGELAALPEQFAAMARLAEQAGFDAIDIKACHRYLLSELLSAYLRAGTYGGDYDNRVRLLLDCVRAARAASRITVTSRLNIYDGYAWPDGFGVSKDGGTAPDLAEPVRLIKALYDAGMPFINLTVGNPYFNPHVNRPYASGGYQPPEHPLRGVERACSLIGQVKRAVPEMKVVASALSYLRGFAGNAAAGMLHENAADFVGFGRLAFAYPDFADRLLKGEALESRKVCLTCSKCTELMRMGCPTGCPVRDPLYTKAYQEAKQK